MNVGDKVIVIANEFEGHDIGTHGTISGFEDDDALVLGNDGEWEGIILRHTANELKIDESKGDK